LSDIPSVFPLTKSMVLDVTWKIVTQLVKKFVPFKEPKSSLLCSQRPTVGLYPEQVKSVPSLTSYWTNINFNSVLSVPKSPKWSHPLRLPDRNFVSPSHFPYAKYMSCPPHLPWVDYSYKSRWRVQIMKLIIHTVFSILMSGTS
jgi:hypothetical protein